MTSRTKEALQDVAKILRDAGWTDDHSIHIGGDVINGQVGQTLTNCTNRINQQPAGERRALLEELQDAVKELVACLPEDRKTDAVESLEALVKQATSERPKRSWYEVAAAGLLDAAKFLKDFTGKIAGTIKNLGKAIWPDFLLPEAK